MATDTLKSTTGASGASAVRRLLLDNGALTALIALVIAMSALSGDFLTTDNLLNIGVQVAPDRHPRLRCDLRDRLGGHRPVGRLGRRAVRHRPRLGWRPPRASRSGWR